MINLSMSACLNPVPMFHHSVSGPKRLGQPGTPGGQDLEAALRSLSARQQNHSSERPFFDVERERKLHALVADCEEGEVSSGFLTPNDSLLSSPAASTGTNYSNGSSRHSCGSGGSRSYLPDRLQIVKPLEGKISAGASPSLEIIRTSVM